MAIDPVQHAAALKAMKNTGAELPIDFETMFDGFAWNLARILVEMMPHLTSDQACMILGIGGAMLRQHETVASQRAMLERLSEPEGRA